MDPAWHHVLSPLKPQLQEISELIAGRDYLPSPSMIFRALNYPFNDVRVLILGQDPYPTPGHACGLSFSVEPDVSPLPRGLQNVFKEYQSDLGYPAPSTGDLTRWAEQGVCLLNRVLTVRPHAPASHAGIGWEAITEACVAALAARDRPLVAILWGRKAQELAPLLDPDSTIQSPHPSPHTAHLGFYNSRPFTRANELLIKQGADPIDWKLP